MTRLYAADMALIAYEREGAGEGPTEQDELTLLQSHIQHLAGKVQAAVKLF